MSRATRPTPQIDIILLGSPGVGKATFISRLPHVQHPSVARREQREAAAAALRANDSQATLVPDEIHHPNGSQATLIGPTSATAADSRFPVQPFGGPQSYNVQLFSRPYKITLHPSTSTLFTDPFPDDPNLLILCYSIPSRASLHNIRHYWMPQYHMHYPTSTVPVLLLGLQRDLRTAKKIEDSDQYECVLPEEALAMAREMRCDRYAECSALTGELLWEVVEDVTRMAAGTTVECDYASNMCSLM